MIKHLGNLVKIKTGKLNANASSDDGKYPFFTCSEGPLKIDTYSYDCECVLVAGNGTLNVKYFNGKFDAYQRTYIIESLDKNVLSVRYLYHFLCSYIETLRNNSIGGIIKFIKLNYLTDAEINLPTLYEQNKIDMIFDKLLSIIEKIKRLSDTYDNLILSKFVNMFGDLYYNEKKWPIKSWNDVLTIRNGKNQSLVEDVYGQYPICGSGGVIGRATNFITNANSVIVGRKGNINSPIIMREPFWNVDTAFGIEPDLNFINVEYLFYFCKFFDFTQLSKTVTIPSLTKTDLLKIKMPIPPIDLQKDFALFVNRIDKSKSKLKQLLEKLDNLYKSLQQEYFG